MVTASFSVISPSGTLVDRADDIIATTARWASRGKIGNARESISVIMQNGRPVSRPRQQSPRQHRKHLKTTENFTPTEGNFTSTLPLLG